MKERVGDKKTSEKPADVVQLQLIKLDVPEDSAQKSYLEARGLLDQIKARQPFEDQEFSFSDDDVARLSAWTIEKRFIFYFVLRAELRYQGEYVRRGITPEKAFCESLGKVIAQIGKFVGIHEGVEKGSRRLHNCVLMRGKYSEGVVPDLIDGMSPILEANLSSEVVRLDALEMDPGTLDAIICDPPYGFNTAEEDSALATLYASFIEKSLAALRENGHFVMCVPADSYTGRELPYCTKSDLIVNQVLVKAQSLGKQIFVPARSIPSRIFTPPYYWESERALRRHILHFRVAANAAHLQESESARQTAQPGAPADVSASRPRR